MSILWLASFPKSGNTWLRAFLHNLFRGQDTPSINRMTELSLGEARVDWFAQHLEGPPEGWSDEAVMAARPKVHAHLAGLGRPHVFVKTHNALALYKGVPLVTASATAGAIYIVRNPLDVVLSYADHMGWTVDGAIAGLATEQVKPTTSRNVVECYGSWSGHVGSWTARPRKEVLVLRYEDMLADPLASFGRVVAFLGATVTPGRLSRAVEASSFASLRRQEEKEGFIERSDNSAFFFRVGKAGQWRDHLTAAQVARITAAHGAQMRRFGYHPDAS